jgi:hypothetical protein
VPDSPLALAVIAFVSFITLFCICIIISLGTNKKKLKVRIPDSRECPGGYDRLLG